MLPAELQQAQSIHGPCSLELTIWDVLSHFSRVRLLVSPWTIARKAPLSMGFSRQEYWSGLPLPFLGDLPNPGIELSSPALQADSLPSEPPGKPTVWDANKKLIYRVVSSRF